LGLGFGDTLVENGSILGGSILGLLGIATLQGVAMTLMLKTLGSNETLNLRSLGVWLLAFTLGLDLTADDELANLKKERELGQHFERTGIAAHTLSFCLQPGCREKSRRC